MFFSNKLRTNTANKKESVNTPYLIDFKQPEVVAQVKNDVFLCWVVQKLLQVQNLGWGPHVLENLEVD